MGNQRVSIGRHAWRALVTGAALALSVTISSADDGRAQKGGRLRNEVVKPAPHNGQLTAPHLTMDWWLRTERGASQGDNKESLKQVFTRQEERQ
ncbi:hypothetical protein FHT82_003104 [Rhizobium sp. BK275]|uniref:hypothetical protein n=1 Tax=unclassified Rhizobium TaxID=2613769 RepID=UPI00161E7621|nr:MULTISPECIES: hypothetical protein [unclassified Rhizobium]MBB3390341.1 hypothetical protein [Rhizobium sp. BK275]MBB3409190.1 hypothetical protein [Rhizobium sp. BK316]